MFPLSILPLPGELVPLHIFEPRYRQLLQDAEANDITFGIFFNHTINAEKVGSVMKLESVLKRFPTGESDIVVRCIDLLSLEKLYRTFQAKLYPGGDVIQWHVMHEPVSSSLKSLYQEFLSRRNIRWQNQEVTVYSIAQDLNFTLDERYQLVTAAERQEHYLLKQLKYKLALLTQEEKSRDVYHLN